MAINRFRLRQLHAWFAPIMVLPVLLTVITGSLFQVAVLTDKSSEFIWLLELHKGKFGSINLQMIYPFLNAFGLLTLAITGISMWFQTRRRVIGQRSRNRE
ncbi:MAG: PepSY domain-containing protein [Moorea sp. SIO3C2]|nr:PepSY domain-containing protein [Moorena sp. SIO3C2]